MASENDCAAPQRYVRQSPALIHEYSLDSMQPRRRRRGPRSYLARLSSQWGLKEYSNGAIILAPPCQL